MIPAGQKDAAPCRAEDLSIGVDLILRSVPAVDDLIVALESAGGSSRLVGALRTELTARRGRGKAARRLIGGDR